MIEPIGPGAQIGDYLLERPVGAGAMGEVYSGRHREIENRVAIKLLRPESIYDKEFVARFRREAAVLAALRHPNIVQIFAFGVHAGLYPYFVMELLEGRTLSSYLTPVRPLGPRHAVRILVEVAKALDWSHQRGIIHRDLKPANIFLIRPELEPTPSTLKVLDFGLAKALDASAISLQPEHVHRTKSGVILGTPGYMAPEQRSGVTVQPATDIFALAAIAHELLTGVRIKPAGPREISGLPDAVEAALAEGLAERMADRPPSALALVAALARGYAAHGEPELESEADEIGRLEQLFEAGEHAPRPDRATPHEHAHPVSRTVRMNPVQEGARDTPESAEPSDPGDLLSTLERTRPADAGQDRPTQQRHRDPPRDRRRDRRPWGPAALWGAAALVFVGVALSIALYPPRQHPDVAGVGPSRPPAGLETTAPSPGPEPMTGGAAAAPRDASGASEVPIATSAPRNDAAAGDDFVSATSMRDAGGSAERAAEKQTKRVPARRRPRLPRRDSPRRARPASQPARIDVREKQRIEQELPAAL